MNQKDRASQNLKIIRKRIKKLMMKFFVEQLNNYPTNCTSSPLVMEILAFMIQTNLLFIHVI